MPLICRILFVFFYCLHIYLSFANKPDIHEMQFSEEAIDRSFNRARRDKHLPPALPIKPLYFELF